MRGGSGPRRLETGPGSVEGVEGTSAESQLFRRGRAKDSRNRHLLSAHCVQVRAPPLHKSFLIRSSALPLPEIKAVVIVMGSDRWGN